MLRSMSIDTRCQACRASTTDADRYVYVAEIFPSTILPGTSRHVVDIDNLCMFQSCVLADNVLANIDHLRPQGVALGLSSFYLASEITLVGAPVALEKIGWRFYLVLICPSIVYIILIYLL